MGVSGGATFLLSSTYKSRQIIRRKNICHSDKQRLDSTIYHSAVRGGTRTECLAEIWNGMPNGTENSWNFQISRKNDNLQRLTKNFKTNLSKISVPFDSVLGFLEILVKYITPNISLLHRGSKGLFVWRESTEKVSAGVKRRGSFGLRACTHFAQQKSNNAPPSPRSNGKTKKSSAN